MGFQLSAGVVVKEIDLSTIIPSVATTTGAFVGNFQWGAIEERTLVPSETHLVNTFGKPDANTYTSFFTAANFLAYGNNLRVVRADAVGALNATANSAAAVLIKTKDIYEASYLDGSGSFGSWAARCAGALGNSLKVSICPSATAFSSNVTSLGSVTANAASLDATTVGTTGNSQPHLINGDYVSFDGGTDYFQVSSRTATTITLTEAITEAVTAGSTILRKWEYADEFDVAPGTSTHATAVSGVNDEAHIIVVDEDGLFTGVTKTILEKYPLVSKGSNAKYDDGTSSYYPNVLMSKSKYIFFGDHATGGTNWGNTLAGTTFTAVSSPQTDSLGGGAYAIPTDAKLQTAWDLFKDAEVSDISLVITGGVSQAVSEYVADNIASARKDCVVFISPLQANCVNNVGGEADAIVSHRNSYTSTSYAFLDGNWKYQLDKYNDVYRWIPLNGDIAGLCVRTDVTNDPWFSPAGFNRGQIKNVVKLAWNPVQTERDKLYKNGINPVCSFPGEGTVLYGDKTLQAKPSAFDRINVRRLFIVLEKAIARAAKYSLFEFNDEFTRAQFVSMVEPFLRDVKGRRGIYDFRVVCDSTNNTGEVIDRNEFIGDIYIKPSRAINFITLNFVAVRTGVSFDEVVGKF